MASIVQGLIGWIGGKEETELDCFIRESNAGKSADAPAIVILQAASDPNTAFRYERHEYKTNLSTLGKTHYLYHTTLDHGRIGEVIGDAKKKLGGRKIMALFVRGHGNKEFIQFGEGQESTARYKKEDVRAEDYRDLDPKAMIILDSCSTGSRRGIANRIAEVQKRAVIAPETISSSVVFYSHKSSLRCESVDEKYEPNGVIFKNNGDRVKRRALSNPKLCHKVFRNAINGNQKSQVSAGQYFLRLYRENPANLSLLCKGIRSLELAEAQGSVEAQKELTLLANSNEYSKVSDLEIGARCMKWAQEGDVSWMSWLGDFFLHGRHGIGDSLESAVKWYAKVMDNVVEKGHPLYETTAYCAKTLLAIFNASNDGNKLSFSINSLLAYLAIHDDKEWIDQLQKATKTTSIEEALRYCREMDCDCEKMGDPVLILQMTQLAAKLGNRSACYKMGLYCESGLYNAKKSSKEAAYWYRRAADLKHPEALEKVRSKCERIRNLLPFSAR